MKILVTGANGQLGSELRDLAPEYPLYRFLFTDVDELDLTDESTVKAFVAADKPDVIINCAAYTAVDKAESEPERAMLINKQAVDHLAKAARKHYAFLVHISTDYIFEGKGYRPLTETDPANPPSQYGKSKLEGEKAVKKHAGKAMIIRTSWLYSPYGQNFMKTMLKKGEELGKLNIIYDQTGTPTYARDLARTILEILQEAVQAEGIRVYHYSNEGVTSWFDFAVAILEMARVKCEIHPIETKEYPLPAQRPYYSVLSKDKIRKDFMITIPYWRTSLAECLERMGYKI